MVGYGVGADWRRRELVAAWACGPDLLMWHLRLAAVAFAGLVLANVTFAPATLWSLPVMIAWTALVAVHAVVVAVAQRRSAPLPAARPLAPETALQRPFSPLFTGDSPTVERPHRPDRPAAVVPVAARSDEGHTVPMTGAGLPPAVVAAAHAPRAHPVPASGRGAAPVQDVAVSVVVLPAPGTNGAGAVVAPTAAGPDLPEHVVALWGGATRRGSTPAAAWRPLTATEAATGSEVGAS